MPSEVAKSWLLFMAIGLGLVAVGAVIDFFLKKGEVRKLHDVFLRWAILLSHTRIRQWQVMVVYAGHNALRALQDKACEALASKTDDLFEAVSAFVPGRESYTLAHYASFSAFCAVFPVAYFLSGWWLLGSIAFPFVVLFLLVWFVYVTEKFASWEYSEDMITALIGVPIISAILSLCATIVTLYGVPEILLDTHWYTIHQGGIKPIYPFLLPIVNLPFDFATISVTMHLLAYVRRRRSAFLAVALLDVLLSLVFSVLLYAILLMIEAGWDIRHIGDHLTSALRWFAAVFGCAGRFLTRTRPIGLVGLQDIHLLPMLLTTFVPVVLYMGALVFLSACKPVMWLAGRFFGVIGERHESVFKQFATLLAVILCAIKALYDYLAVK